MKIEEPADDLSALLAAVAGGDAEAVAALYRQLEEPVYAFAMSRLGDPQRAADVLHEVMLQVWRRAGTFSGRSRPLTWVLGIARHKVADAHRRRRRRRPEAPPGDDLPDPGAAAPGERLEEEERCAAVRRALASIPERQREVVHLAFYQDLPYPEIARLLGVPHGTVKTRMFHAKKALRRLLGAGGGEEEE